MKSYHFLTESHVLLEGRRIEKLWEGVGYKLKEAALSPEQIQQIFAAAESGATAAGGNRTMIGKGKDAAEAVNKAWEDLKTKIQNSAPIANVDSTYDGVVAKIEAGLGGPDNAINQVIQRYRKFAKEHPIAQAFIYSALIAAAGISGAGLGGAAVLGLLKMTDKLLQGDKFSSAAYSGAKTGAMAYGASQLAQHMKGGDTQASGGATGNPDMMKISGSMDSQAHRAMYQAMQADPSLAHNPDALAQIYTDTIQKLNPNIDYQYLRSQAEMVGMKLANVGNTATGAASSSYESRNPYVDKQLTLFEWGLSRQLGQPRGGVQLTHAGVQKVFEFASIRIVTEAFSDLPGAKPPQGNTVAPAAPAAAPTQKPGLLGKAANWLKTKGKNLTTKVTADKLNSAWQKAKSPTDSEQVAQVMQGAGVTPEVVAGAFKQAGVPAPAGAEAPAAGAPARPTAAIGSNLAGGAGAATPKPGAATAQSTTGAAPAAGGAATPKPGAASANATGGRDVNAVINQTAKAQGMDASGKPIAGAKSKAPGAPGTPTSAPQAGALATAAATPKPAAGGVKDPRDTNGDGTIDATEKSIARNAAKTGKGAAPAAATPTAAPAGAGAFGAMAGQLGSAPAAPTTSSTGGTITPTATGMVHTAKPAAAPAPAAATPTAAEPAAPKPTQAELDADNERLASGTMESRRNQRGKKVTVQEELINEYEAFLMKQYENTRNHSTRRR
jgi:hypothetical protein